MVEWLLNKFCRTVTMDVTELQYPSGRERQIPLTRLAQGDMYILSDEFDSFFSIKVERYNRWGVRLKIIVQTEIGDDYV